MDTMSKPMRILVIDDSEDDRLLYRRALQKKPDAVFEVFDAESGEEGLCYLEQEAVDCILLDYSLPGHNGVEVLKRIRMNHPFIPVVMMTGQGNETVAVTAMKEGAQDYISKSMITPDALQRVIRVAMDHCAMQKRIREQHTSLEIFTRALAHDLKEPLRTIRCFAELITASKEPLSEKNSNYFQFIGQSAARMQMLIDTVFTYTCLDNPAQMPREPCEMDALLNEVKQNLDQLLCEHKAAIHSDHLPIIMATRAHIIQLLQNLIANAIRHSKRSVEIYIGAEEKPDHWIFRVRDNGPGIEQEYLKSIFEPFKRLVQSTDAAAGAGLGLAICYKIVESHGGKIWCESEFGKGAIFVFTIPKVEASSPAISSEMSAATVPLKHTSPGKLPLANILVVDDRQSDIELTRVMLVEYSQLECNLFYAQGAQEALDTLYQHLKDNRPIDLILLDINMPGMNGFELLEHMRRDKKLEHVPVVICTGSTYDKDRERAKVLGAEGYILKPARFDNLKLIIDDITTLRIVRQNDHPVLLRAA
jgi:signal transduction histidine kinase